ncbi:MAG: sigma-70 family RNA polymerase sigma factor [Pseudomonadota bacterium]
MKGLAPRTDPPLDEAALVARITAREEAALRAAIDAYAGVLHRVVYRMMGDAHEAEDIAQEAMLRLWDNAEKLSARNPSEIKLAAWLKRVAINLAYDRLRLLGRMSDADVPERADEDKLADAKIEENEEHAAARALIAALPDRQRAAIILTYYEELPNAEAADVLDMQLKAFESLLFRARAALRKAFQAQTAEGGVT